MSEVQITITELSDAVTAETGETVQVVVFDGGPGPAGADGTDGVDGTNGTNGTNGVDGQDGTNGTDGADGQGVPVGGTSGQVLAKVDATDFNTEWVDQTGGGGSGTVESVTAGDATITVDNADPANPTVGVTAGTFDAAGAAATAQTNAEGYTDTAISDEVTRADGAYATAAQGAEADSAVQPGDLATVATTGAYGDLSGKPTLGTAAAAATGDFDAAGAADAKVLDSIADADTTHAPSRNAVFDALALKAPLASPALTGTPTVPTASPGTNSTQAASTAYADAAAAAAAVGLLDYRGTYNASTNLFPATGGSGLAGAVVKGDFWICSVQGTLGGTVARVGDLIIAIVDTPAQTAANWDLIEHDVGYAPEDVANKSIDGTLAANSDTLYPSQKAAKTYADGKVENAITSGHTAVAPSGDAVNTALALKAPLDSPALTGSPTVPTRSAGDNSTKAASTAYADSAVAKQPEVLIIAVSDETTAITTGAAKVTFRMPFAMTLTSVRASLTAASTSGIPAVNIKESGTTIFSTTLTIDANELTSTTAATAAVLSDTSLADDAQMTIDIDTAGTGAKGLKVYLLGTRT